MSCGIHLGILLICLVQAEHVCCSWASQALSSQRPDGNRYVGFSQQEGAGRHSSISSYPQSGFRQASIQPSNANPTSSLRAGYSELFSSGSSAAVAPSQVAPSSKASPKLVQSGSLSRPNLHAAKETSSDWVNAKKTPKRPLTGLSTAIVSGSSLSKNSRSGASRKSLPVQQGAARVGSYPSSSSATLNRFGSSKAQQSSYSPMQSFSSGVGQTGPIRMQTSASAPGRKVPVRRGSKTSRFTPRSPRAGTLSGSKLFTAPRGYKSLFTDFQPRTSGSQRSSYSSSNSGSLQASWSSNSEGASSGQRFAPTRTYNIPSQFGGFAIRRLKEPADKPEVAVRKPAQVYAAPSQVYAAPSQQSTSLKPQVPSVHPASKWQKVRRVKTSTGPSGALG